MGQVTMTIAGRAYRMACGDGEEEHLTRLGRLVDAKIAELRAAFGEIGDLRLAVMAAITMADDLNDAQRRLAALETDRAGLAQAHDDALKQIADGERAAADAVTRAAERLERITRHLSGTIHRRETGATGGEALD